MYNRERHNASHRIWCAKNKDKVHNYYLKRKARPDWGAERNERLKKWRAANPEKCRAYAKKQYQKPGYKQKAARYNRKRRLRKEYNITPEQYQSLLDLQNGCCRLCDTAPPYRLGIDHNHTTGEVRGLLCQRCNYLVGMIETTPIGVLYKVLAYLS